MMNFLDLSSASEEERRLITDLLSDTSVVNFAEPLIQQYPTQLDQEQQPQQHIQHQHQQPHYRQQQNRNSQQINNRSHNSQQHNHQHSQQQSQPTTVKQQQQQQQNNHNQHSQQHHNYITHHDISSSLPDLLAKTTTTIHTSLANNNATYTTSNVTQSTSTVPPQTVANQIAPLMAGDINSVIGMEMASSQPPGYPMPTPQPTHVTAYGPAPPPPPHYVYGGPPIFQPYAAHYIFPYNLPYPMSYVLPPTNSVVPTRQVAPQSNQQANQMMPNSHPRPQTHHPRSSKLKEMPKQQHQHQHHSNHNHNQQQHHQLHQHNQAYRSNVNPETPLSRQDDTSGLQTDPHENYVSKTNHQQTMQKPEDNAGESKPIADVAEPEIQVEQWKEQQPQHASKVQQDFNGGTESTRVITEEETVKVSSDEGFDTQSSLDLSKQSHDSAITDKSHPKGDANATILNAVSTQSNNDEKSQLSQEAKSTGPWGSASSKSWASLFRPEGATYNGQSINGDCEHDNLATETDNPEAGGKTSLNVASKQEINRQSPTLASTKEQRSQDVAKRAQDKMAPKLAQKINSISLKHSLPLLRPRGFINKGNGCYINSTLQALIACPPFYNLMKEIGEFRVLKRDSSCTPILDSFAELFQNFPPLEANKKNKQVTLSEQKLPMNYLQAEAIEPRCIYNVLGQIKSECLRGAQEDAEEFLSSVLNGLHEEMIGLSETLQSSQNNSSHQNGHLSDTEDNGGDINNDDNLWREVGPKNRSLPIRAATVINTPIQEIFGGSLFSIRTAGKDRVGHRSPFFDLQLDISGDNVKSLQDAIKSFTATEIIQDFYCSKTKQKLDAQRRTSLDQLPPILILHLKQFIYTQDHGLKKLMKRIEYPIDFELPESCLHDKNSDKSLKNSRSYKLLAVVYHEGKEAVKGHYLTDVYHIGSSQWIRCDDSNLKVVPAPRIENQESSRTPYLLFYRRLNTLGPRQSSSHDYKKKN